MPIQDDVLVIENPELLEALKKAPEKVMRHLTDAMSDGLFMVQGEIGYASYPPATEANAPGRFDAEGRPMGYYERGRGWWYPVLQDKTLGGVNSVKEGAQTIQSAYKRAKISTKKIKMNSDLVVVPGKIVKQMPGSRTYQEVSVVERKTPVVAGYKLARGRNGERGTSELLGKSWTVQFTRTATEIAGEIGTPVTYADNVQGFDVPSFHRDRGWVPMPERLEELEPRVEARFDKALEDYLAEAGEL